MDIAELLAFAVKNNASDLHLSSGLPPMIRVDGDIRRLTLPALDTAQLQELVYSTMSDKHRRILKRTWKSIIHMRYRAWPGSVSIVFITIAVLAVRSEPFPIRCGRSKTSAHLPFSEISLMRPGG